MANETYKYLTLDDKKVKVDSAVRDGEGYKISTHYATKEELTSKELALQDAINAEALARSNADDALNADKFSIPYGDDTHGIKGEAFNVPYYFHTDIDAEKAVIHADTLSLGNTKKYQTFNLTVDKASTEKAGLLSASDKVKLDATASQVALQTETDARIAGDNTLDTKISAEETRAKAEEAKKADLPPQCPDWLNPTKETPYPWLMASLDVESTGLGPDAEGNIKANVGAYNFNYKLYYQWKKNIPFAATTSKAGLMTASDKVKLDNSASQVDLDAEVTRAKGVEQALDANKLNLLPNVDDPTDPGYGWPYHIPYNFKLNVQKDTAAVTSLTITFDNKATKMDFTKDLPIAATTNVGLMSGSQVEALNAKYVKPDAGIPKTDLANDVQASLGKADTALQEHLSLDAYRKAVDQDVIDAKKVTKTIIGSNGTAEIFNESDGGGAHFIHTDGTESFVGVNDGGKDGLVAQIYADRFEEGSWKGSRINIYHNGIYYVSKANLLAGYDKNAADMEIATKKDIKDLGQALHFVGIAEKQEGETELQAVERTFPAASQKAGAIAICGAKEFICAGTPLSWREFGDVSLYATRAELAAETRNRLDADAALEILLDEEVARAQTAEAKKVDKEITSTNGKAIIFNEADGGGAKFESNDGTASFVGVNENTNGGIGAQLYDIDVASNAGSKIDITKNGVFYTKGEASALPAAQRDVVKNEIATLPDNCPPWLNPTGETPYPWFMASLDVESEGLGPDADGNIHTTVGAYNFNLKAYYQWRKTLPFAATTFKAGLMTAADKTNFDKIEIAKAETIDSGKKLKVTNIDGTNFEFQGGVTDPATENKLGLVQAAPAGLNDTLPVNIGADNKLYTAPSSLKKAIVADRDMGSIKKGDSFPIGTPLEDLIRKILELPEYTLTFKPGEGASGTEYKVEGLEEGSEYTLPANTAFSKQYNTFAGWRVDDGATIYQPGEKITITKNADVVAQWTPWPVVTYNANGGSGSMNPAYIDPAVGKHTLPTCGFTAPTGTRFKAWSVAGIEHAVGDEITILTNTEVTAIWLNQYTVTFDGNGATSGSMDPVIADAGNYTLPASSFIKTNNDFIGWKVNGAGDTLTVGTVITLNANITLVAQWQVVSYTLTYKKNSEFVTGTDKVVTVTSAQASTYTLLYANTITEWTVPDTLIFDQWSISGVTRDEGSAFTPTGDTEILATWAIKRTVTYNANGGSGTMASDAIKDGANYTFKACTFTAPENKVFDKWAINSTSGTLQPAGYVYNNLTLDLVLYAIWKDKPTDVLVYLGGSGDRWGIPELSDEYTESDLLTDLTKPGVSPITVTDPEKNLIGKHSYTITAGTSAAEDDKLYATIAVPKGYTVTKVEVGGIEFPNIREVLDTTTMNIYCIGAGVVYATQAYDITIA